MVVTEGPTTKVVAKQLDIDSIKKGIVQKYRFDPYATVINQKIDDLNNLVGIEITKMVFEAVDGRNFSYTNACLFIDGIKIITEKLERERGSITPEVRQKRYKDLIDAATEFENPEDAVRFMSELSVIVKNTNGNYKSVGTLIDVILDTCKSYTNGDKPPSKVDAKSSLKAVHAINATLDLKRNLDEAEINALMRLLRAE